MVNETPPTPALAPTVCIPCKRRKKACDKALPACRRCSRLLVKCEYPASVDNENDDLQDGNSTFKVKLPLPFFQISNGLTTPPRETSPLKNGSKSCGILQLATPEQTSTHIIRLLDSISPNWEITGAFCDSYFNTFHHSLPLVNKELFYHHLSSFYQNPNGDSHFSLLLLGMILITQLAPQTPQHTIDSGSLYSILKPLFSLTHSGSKISLEIVQTGLLLASWEYSQDKLEEAWLTIGVAVRMAQSLRLHELVKIPMPRSGEVDENERLVEEMKRCVWWCVVIIERIINTDLASNLPNASFPPSPNDFLPLVPLKDGTDYRVQDELLLPQNVHLGLSELQDRAFTRFGSFAATVQTTYLSSLVDRHVEERGRGEEERDIDARKLDAALQNFGGALIPGPGEAQGHYCAAYSIRTRAIFKLHVNCLSHPPSEVAISRSTLAIQSLLKVLIFMTRLSFSGVPMDVDALSFSSHRMIAVAAMLWIDERFGIRTFDTQKDWEEGVEVCKIYMRYFAPRYELYRRDLEKIEAAHHEATQA